MRAVGEADRGRGARHFLDRDAMLEIAEPKPAVFLRRGDAVQAERAHLRPEVARETGCRDRSRRRAARSPSRRRRASTSRIMSALSPRSKLKGGAALGIMGLGSVVHFGGGFGRQSLAAISGLWQGPGRGKKYGFSTCEVCARARLIEALSSFFWNWKYVN